MIEQRRTVSLSPADVRSIDRICNRFESAWQLSERPDTVTYLNATTEPLRSALLRELLLLDWDYRRRAGEFPRNGDYHERFPRDSAIVEAVAREMEHETIEARASSNETEANDTPWSVQRTHSQRRVPVPEQNGSERYELLQEVGSGGIGVVYRGRDRQLGREVAVKVLRDEYRDCPEARRRFTVEAQIGSRLQHPAIIPVYDQGWFGDRRPYFTMKLVEGCTLAALLSQRAGEDLPRLLGVFGQVCQAMAYAHARGVIHRDLKPANIMVGAFGEVQVMDWGFAKVLTDDTMHPAAEIADYETATRSPMSSEEGATQSGDLMGTPAYMSPEQARGDVGQVDQRADVFALGAILCEILTGRPPFPGDTADEVCHRAASGDTDDAFTRIDACGADPALCGLAKKCLRADSNGRLANAGVVTNALTEYQTSAESRRRQADLDRASAVARENEARATAQAERRVRKLAVTVALALLLGAGLATWQALVATHAKQDAQIAADARKEAKEIADVKEAETRAILDFVNRRILAAARPRGLEGGLGPGVTLRAAIDASVPFVDKSFADRPLIEAQLRAELGNSYLHLADPTAAIAQFQAAYFIFSREHGPDHADTLACAVDLGRCYPMQGRFREAAKLNEDTLSRLLATKGPDDLKTLHCANNLAMVYFELEEYDRAIELHRDTLARKRARVPPDEIGIFNSMINLANCYSRSGKIAEALELREQTVSLQKAKLGLDNYGTLMGMHNLANSYRDFDRFADALKVDREVLARRRATLGDDHTDTLSSLMSVGKDLLMLNRGDEAIPLLDQVFEKSVGKYVHKNLWKWADLRLRYFEKARNPAGCVATAELWEKQKRTDADSLLEAARCRAVAAAVICATDNSSGAGNRADGEAKRALAWLQKALTAGQLAKAIVANDKDFDCLRSRADFRKLLAERTSQGQ